MMTLENSSDSCERRTRRLYKGKIAKTIDRYMRRIGGDLTYSDLATHTSEWVDPVCVDYREVQLCELPPNGQGFAALQMVSILKNANLAQWKRDDPKSLAFPYRS